MYTCDLCGKEVRLLPQYRDINSYICKRCGKVEITDIVTAVLLHDDNFEKKKYLLSGLTRYHTEYNLPPINILASNIEELLNSNLIPTNNTQKLNILLNYFDKKSEYAGYIVKIDITNDYPVAFCKNDEEFSFILEELETSELIKRITESTDFQLTMKGWNKVNQIKENKGGKRQAFIAMWFDKTMDMIYQKGFKRAVEDCGFEPIRIDLKQHNNKIDDEIDLEIENSEFIIADFTGQRNGVYFEAGFAKGSKIPVIWTCKHNELDKLHFDTRQYNHIEWLNEDDLYEKLVKRINETININKNKVKVDKLENRKNKNENNHQFSQINYGKYNFQLNNPTSVEINQNTKKIVKNIISPTDEHITDKQALIIKNLIDEIVRNETLSSKYANVSKSYKNWFNKLYKKFDVTSYKLIPKELFSNAENWLHQQIAILRPKLRKKDNEEWRKQIYKSIYAKTKAIKFSKEDLYNFVNTKLILKNYINSITELTDKDLGKLYDIIMRIK